MKRFLTIILCIVLSLVVMTGFGCGEAPQPNTPNKPSTPTPPVVAEPQTIINPFNTQKQLSTMVLRGQLGKAELNADKNFITEGAGSLKVTVDPNPIGGGYEAPLLYQMLNQTEIGGPDFTLFDEIPEVCIDVYNAQDEDMRIGLRFVFTYNPWGATDQSKIEWLELKPGWNRLSVETNREYMSTNADNQIYVMMIAILFDRPEETNTVFYLDNLRQIYDEDYEEAVDTAGIDPAS